jgi:GNAT superfamily N-acetyltransferase
VHDREQMGEFQTRCWRQAYRGLELKSLYVDAVRYGSGIAAALRDLALGAADAQLWCFEDNPRARGFYAKHGFHPDGARTLDPDTGVQEVRLVRRA